MRKHLAISAIMTLCLASASTAFAQHDDHRRHDDRRGHYPQRGYEREHGRHHDARDDWRGGPRHHWRKGDRLPEQYRGRHYVVDDWRAHRLSPPPRGYHWVQVGGDYVLVANNSGIILQFTLGG